MKATVASLFVSLLLVSHAGAAWGQRIVAKIGDGKWEIALVKYPNDRPIRGDGLNIYISRFGHGEDWTVVSDGFAYKLQLLYETAEMTYRKEMRKPDSRPVSVTAFSKSFFSLRLSKDYVVISLHDSSAVPKKRNIPCVAMTRAEAQELIAAIRSHAKSVGFILTEDKRKEATDSIKVQVEHQQP